MPVYRQDFKAKNSTRLSIPRKNSRFIMIKGKIHEVLKLLGHPTASQNDVKWTVARRTDKSTIIMEDSNVSLPVRRAQRDKNISKVSNNTINKLEY